MGNDNRRRFSDDGEIGRGLDGRLRTGHESLLLLSGLCVGQRREVIVDACRELRGFGFPQVVEVGPDAADDEHEADDGQHRKSLRSEDAAGGVLSSGPSLCQSPLGFLLPLGRKSRLGRGLGGNGCGLWLRRSLWLGRMKLRQETVQIGLGVGIAFEAEQIEDVGFGQCRGDGVAAAGIERGISPFAKVIGVETELDEAPRRRRGELVVHVQPTVQLAAGRDGFCKFSSRKFGRCTGMIRIHDCILYQTFRYQTFRLLSCCDCAIIPIV